MTKVGYKRSIDRFLLDHDYKNRCGNHINFALYYSSSILTSIRDNSASLLREHQTSVEDVLLAVSRRVEISRRSWLK